MMTIIIIYIIITISIIIIITMITKKLNDSKDPAVTTLKTLNINKFTTLNICIHIYIYIHTLNVHTLH